MKSCSECNKELSPFEGISQNDLHFCNNLCRVLYERKIGNAGPAAKPAKARVATGETASGKSGPKTRIRIFEALATAIGAAVGGYGGWNLVVPFVGIVAAFILFGKLRPSASVNLKSAVSIQVGQAVWLLVGAILLQALPAAALELVGFAVAIFYLALRPGIVPISILCVYQVGMSVLNTVRLLAAEEGSMVSKALVVHLFLRAGAIAFMVLLAREILSKDPETKLVK